MDVVGLPKAKDVRTGHIMAFVRLLQKKVQQSNYSPLAFILHRIVPLYPPLLHQPVLDLDAVQLLQHGLGGKPQKHGHADPDSRRECRETWLVCD